MRHNFDEIINRRVSECKKYEAACYPEDVLPMWIADTDFAVPAEISEASTGAAIAQRSVLSGGSLVDPRRAGIAAFVKWENAHVF